MADHVWLGPTHGCVSLLPVGNAANHRSTLSCWGATDDGEGAIPRRFATPVDLGGGVTQLALGEKHSCGVFDSRVIRCWGDDEFGQLGDVPLPAWGKETNRLPGRRSLIPIEVPESRNESGVLEVHVGKSHTCARLTKKRLTCFGSDENHQLNDLGSWYGVDVRTFTVGDSHTCVGYAGTDPSESVVACRGDEQFNPTKQGILRGVSVKALAAGHAHTCALLADTSVKCWGKDDQGQLGDSGHETSLVPVNVSDLRGADQIASGANHVCVHLMNDTVACWGDNRHHQLANGTTTSTGSPAVIVGLVQAKEIACAGDGCCARMDDRSVRCWGANDRYELGTASTVEQSVPMPIHFHE